MDVTRGMAAQRDMTGGGSKRRNDDVDDVTRDCRARHGCDDAAASDVRRTVATTTTTTTTDDVDDDVHTACLGEVRDWDVRENTRDMGANVARRGEMRHHDDATALFVDGPAQQTTHTATTNNNNIATEDSDQACSRCAVTHTGAGDRENDASRDHVSLRSTPPQQSAGLSSELPSHDDIICTPRTELMLHQQLQCLRKGLDAHCRDTLGMAEAPKHAFQHWMYAAMSSTRRGGVAALLPTSEDAM